MKPVILQPEPQAWLSSSILSPYQDRYVARLREDRYAHNVIRVYLASVAHFARWLSEQQITSLNEAVLDHFLNDHLPICSCPQPVRRTRYELRTAIRHLLRLLEAERIIRPADERDERSRELAAFDIGAAQAVSVCRNQWMDAPAARPRPELRQIMNIQNPDVA